MARLRNTSLEPDRRTRKASQPPETVSRLLPLQEETRIKSASPSLGLITRKTAFKRDQPTPVRPQQIATRMASPPQQQLAKKVVKRTGRTGSRRAVSVESDRRRSSAGSENGGVMITESTRQALPLVPENGEVSSSTNPKFLPAQLTIPRGYSPALSSAFSTKSESPSRFSTPGLDTTGTQLELADMDMDLMLETFPDLDTYAQKILDLLILRPPTEDLLRDLRVPGSKSSKRLRLYEQNFIASKSAYGTPLYLATHIVEQALNSSRFNSLLHKANLAVLANFTYTAQESSDNTFQELKEVERFFPRQFGDVVHERNFDVALDIRTHTLILGMMKNQELPQFNPDVFLQYFFLDIPGGRGPGNVVKYVVNQYVKGWEGMKPVEGWKIKVLKRIEQIRATFNEKRAEERVDFDELANLFPWEQFVDRLAAYVRTRLAEIEKNMEGTSISDLVEAVRDAADTTLVSTSPEKLAAAGLDKYDGDVAEKREAPESVHGSDQGFAMAPEADFEKLPTQLPNEKKDNVKYPQLPTVAESVDATLEEASRIDNMQTLKIAPFKKLKKRLQEQEHESLELPSIISNTAQMKELKRRKTEPSQQKKAERPVTRATTSLDTQDSIGVTKAHIRLLKSLKNEIRASRLKTKQQEEMEEQKKIEEELEEEGEKEEEEQELEEEEELEDEELDATQKPPSSSAVVWKQHYKTLERNKNKENDKALAVRLPRPASPARDMKRKRFLDRQEGATRVSQIEGDAGGDASLPKRQQVEKGKVRALHAAENDDAEPRVSRSNRGSRPADKGKGRTLPPAEEQVMQARASQANRVPRPVKKGKGPVPPVGDEAGEVQVRASHGNREPKPVGGGIGRAPPPPAPVENDLQFRIDDDDEVDVEEDVEEGGEEEDEEGEEEDDFGHDARADNEERLKKSRRNLDSTGAASTARAGASSRASKSPVRSSEQDNAAQQQMVPHRGPRQRTPTDADESDEEPRKSDSQVARVNRLAKDVARDRYTRNSAPSAPKRQIRATWGSDESDLLVKMVGEVGCRWATIRDMREPLFRGRTDVQLKDKARNIKFDYLKTRVPLPLNFEFVTISRRQIEVLQEMGVDLE